MSIGDYTQGLQNGLERGREEAAGTAKILKEDKIYKMMSSTGSHDFGFHMALLAETDSNGKTIESPRIYKIDIEDYEDMPSKEDLCIAKKADDAANGESPRVVLKPYKKKA